MNGTSTLENITVPTVVKTSPGRVASVSIITGGSGTGMIYDSSQLTILTAPLYVIPDTVSTSPYVVNMPTDTGIVIVPSSGMAVTVNWS